MNSFQLQQEVLRRANQEHPHMLIGLVRHDESEAKKTLREYIAAKRRLRDVIKQSHSAELVHLGWAWDDKADLNVIAAETDLRFYKKRFYQRTGRDL